MNIFVSGGCKNGKSMFAQMQARDMAREQGKLYYVATMIPRDGEDRERIRRHIADREGWGFQTIEKGMDIVSALDDSIDRNGVFLLDSVTALLSNEMFGADGSYNPEAGDKVGSELEEFAKLTGNTIFVSDYIYSDARIFDDYTENYRRALAGTDRRLAAVCDLTVEVAYGHKYYYWKEKR